MKHFKFLSVVVMLVLVVAAIGCTPMQETSDEYYERQPVRREVYLSNPYYGAETVILQRDPYTGRYYQVSPYGGYLNTYDPYTGTGRYYDNRRYYRNYPQQQQTQQQRSGSEKINDAKKIITGRNN